MTIRLRLTLSSLVIAVLICLLAAVNYYLNLKSAEHLAQDEAESIARAIAFSLTAHTLHGQPPSAANVAELQRHIIKIRDIQQRDIAVVDNTKMTIADAVPQEVGSTFSHDKNNEVGQTLVDGMVRTFEEISPAYPEGIRSLVIPMDSEGGVRLGALVYEYTPLLNEITRHERESAALSLVYFGLALVVAGAGGYVVSRRIVGPLKNLQEAAERIASGDLGARVRYEGKDELGSLVDSFNKMAADMQTARDELAFSRNYLQSIIEAEADCVMLLDADCTVHDINTAGAAMVGSDKAALIGGKLCILVEGDYKKVFDGFVRAVCAGQPGTLQYRVRDAMGRSLWLESHGVPFEDKAAGQTLMLAVTRDVTDKVNIQEALIESEKRFRHLFESANDAIFILSMDGHFLDINRASYERLGYTKDEMLSMHISELDPPEFADRVPERIEKILKEGKAVFESAHRYKGGAAMPVEVSTRVVEMGAGRVLMSVVRDITERKRAQEAIVKRERQLAESQRIAHIGSWEHNITTNEVAWSDELFHLLGLDPKKDAGDFNNFFSRIHPEDQKVLSDAIKRTVQSGEHFSVEYRYQRPDGITRVLHAQAELTTDPTGTQKILTGTGQDITERREAEDSIRRALVEKEVLLKEIHHRVKNNMAIISSLLRFQSRHTENQEARHILEDSRNRISAMALVHEKLYEADNLSSIDLQDYVQGLVRFLLETYSTKKVEFFHDIAALRMDIEGVIPLGLILNEMITNSLEHAFAGEGPYQISLSIKQEGGQVTLLYRDSGPGLPEGISLKSNATLGLRIIDMLTHQLKGTVELVEGDRAAFALSFRLGG